MQYREYYYESKRLFVIGLIFLLAFPTVVASVVWFGGLWQTNIVVALAGIYLIDLVITVWLFLGAWKKSLIIDIDSLGFSSKLFCRNYRAKEIQEIMLFAKPDDREFLRVKTKKGMYYLDEQYQPWGKLLEDLEKFTNKFGITSNLRD